MRSREHIEKEPEFIVSLESRCLSNQRVLDPICRSVSRSTQKGLTLLAGTCLMGLVQQP